MSRLENCTDLDILLFRMHTDLQVYCEAVAQLAHRDKAMTLDAAYERSERARIAFEGGRQRLKAHIAEHGCVGGF
jgi:hypothetical protein